MSSRSFVRAGLGALGGLLFGLGLVLGGMVDPSRVKSFLDVTGPWNPELAGVMGSALVVAAVAFAYAKRHPRAWTGDSITPPGKRSVDLKLITGGVMFGVGWGIAGYCPGPALLGLSMGDSAAWWFVPAMLAGMLGHDAVTRRSGHSPPDDSPGP